MALGKKTGGRKKGTRNRNTIEAQLLAKEMGVNPLQILLWIAAGDYKALGYNSEYIETKFKKEERIPLNMRKSAAKEVLPYLTPQLKSIELDATVDAEIGSTAIEDYLENLVTKDK